MTKGRSYRRAGLTKNPAYTTIGVAEYGGEKLVIMRDPKGAERYSGPWSDKSTKWTDAAKKALNHTTANDGKFFVPLTMYPKYFGSTVINFL